MLDAIAEDLRALDIDVITDDLEPYGRDETMDLFSAPGIVVRPRSTPEVSEVLRLAQKENIPVTPRGGGTGKAGGCIPVSGGIVLSLERMNRIKEIDASNRFAVVEPGVILHNLHEACAEHDLLYPVDMSSGGSCMIGGNLACNAGGERAVKYGTTRAQVTGAEAVLMSGSVIRSGGKLAKNSAGFALHQLLVGSEGTLAVITEATLRLVPLPPFRRTLLAPFASLDRAAEAALAIERIPSAIELIERAAAKLAEEMLGQPLPHAGAAALLLVEIEEFSDARAQEAIETVAEALLEAGAEDVELAKREKVWGVRHAVAEAIKRLPAYSAVDTVVPRRAMPELIRRAHAVARHNGVEVVCFGHAGDGNIHVDFVKRDTSDAANEAWDRGIGPAIRGVLEATVSLGGSITGEHGVGMLRQNDMSLQFDAPTLDAMRALKTAWDPNGLLNPGKIWPQG